MYSPLDRFVAEMKRSTFRNPFGVFKRLRVKTKQKFIISIVVEGGSIVIPLCNSFHIRHLF